MRKIGLFILLLLATCCLNAQKLFTRSGQTSFFSYTPIENIAATNNNAMSILDPATGQIVFSLTIKDFKFKDQLMEDHFNEKYLESEKYPKSQFEGKIENLSSLDFSKDGEYDVSVSGKLTMHGVTNDMVAKGKIMVKNKTVKATSSFQVKLVDYKIEVPTIVFAKIAQVIDVKTELSYEPYK